VYAFGWRLLVGSLIVAGKPCMHRFCDAVFTELGDNDDARSKCAPSQAVVATTTHHDPTEDAPSFLLLQTTTVR
jgi:hypothetical protein